MEDVSTPQNHPTKPPRITEGFRGGPRIAVRLVRPRMDVRTRAVPRPWTDSPIGRTAALTAVVLFGVLTLLVVTSLKALLNVDATVTGTLHAYAITHTGFTRAMQAVSDIGSGVTWWIVLAGVSAWLAWNRRARLSLFVIATGVGGSLINALIKSAVNRARPTFPDPVSLAAGRSFPSGHTQGAVVGCGILLIVFLPRVIPAVRIGVVAAAAIVVGLIGFSRVALGVHYPSDVVGGVLVGLAWLYVMATAFQVGPGAAARRDYDDQMGVGRGSDAERSFAALADDLLADPDVTEGTGFGSNPGLRVHRKIFAMLVQGQLVVKLPPSRCAQLRDDGDAAAFDAGKGRPMREWIAVGADSMGRWPDLAAEALGYVRSTIAR